MNIINGITNQPTQIVGIILPDGSRVTLTLYFRPQQNGWFFDVEWPGSPNSIITPFTVQNRRLVAAGNLLRQFQNIIPFGLLCVTVDNSDPITQACLVDGSVQIVLLNPDDIATIESEVYTPA